MRVTIVDGDLSYPPNSGKRLRTLNLMLPLAQRHALTYVARCEARDGMAEAAAFFRDHRIEPVLVHAPLATRKGARFAIDLGLNLVQSEPYSVVAHKHAAMREAVAAQIARWGADLVQLEWQGYLYCVEHLATPFVIQAHNVDALIWQRYAETESHPARRLYVRDQHRKVLRFEARAFAAADRIMAVSEQDALLARKLYGPLPIDVVDNGVDVAGFASLKPASGSRTILFLGALDWRPNIDAADILLDEIFPLVRSRVPDARLAIVGRRPPARLVERARSMEGVELHADVPDVKDYLAASAVMAVPLRIGGGSRLKILESLAAGLPVVSTRVGAEGLALEVGEHFTAADTPPQMAAALAKALADPEASLAQGARGRHAIARRYDWGMLAGLVEGSWERTLASRARPAA